MAGERKPRYEGEISVATFIEKLRALPQAATIAVGSPYGLCPPTACIQANGIVRIVGDIDALARVTDDRAAIEAARKKSS